MLKTVSLLIIVFSLSLLFGFDLVRSAPRGSTPAAAPTPMPTCYPTPKKRPKKVDLGNKPANVDSVELDKTQVYILCPPGYKQRREGCPGDLIANVVTKASDPENDTLIYAYETTGGVIEGAGKNVKWDLSGVRPGTYLITVGVDDGNGVCGKTITRDVVVMECAACYPYCECPQIEVKSDSENVQPGQTITFTAEVTGGSSEIDTYNWTVSKGKIVEGQGTIKIKVDTTGLAGKTVKATVEIAGTGDCLAVCPTTGSKSVAVSR